MPHHYNYLERVSKNLNLIFIAYLIWEIGYKLVGDRQPFMMLAPELSAMKRELILLPVRFSDQWILADLERSEGRRRQPYLSERGPEHHRNGLCQT
jgi:hypothetical protein